MCTCTPTPPPHTHTHLLGVSHGMWRVIVEIKVTALRTLNFVKSYDTKTDDTNLNKLKARSPYSESVSPPTCSGPLNPHIDHQLKKLKA